MNKWTGDVVAYIDMLMSLFVVFVALSAPVTQPTRVADKPICQMAIDIQWQDNVPVDVDLWVQAPGDRPVGYSNKSGQIVDLVRDDTGIVFSNDETNSERACVRFIADGNYIVNVHLYNSNIAPTIPVSVVINLVDPSAATMTEIFKKDVILNRVGEELTVVQFEMERGKLTGSNDIPVKIREARKEGRRG